MRGAEPGQGQCVTSPEGYVGLWLNPQAHATSPYHANCLELGSSSVNLTLRFPAQAELYLAKDGSGGSVLNFSSSGVTPKPSSSTTASQGPRPAPGSWSGPTRPGGPGRSASANRRSTTRGVSRTAM